METDEQYDNYKKFCAGIDSLNQDVEDLLGNFLKQFDEVDFGKWQEDIDDETKRAWQYAVNWGDW
jgi:hypothetical protein